MSEIFCPVIEKLEKKKEGTALKVDCCRPLEKFCKYSHGKKS